VPTIQPLNHSDKWNKKNIVEAELSAQKMTPCYKSPARTIRRTRNNECNEVGGKLREEIIQHTSLLHNNNNNNTTRTTTTTTTTTKTTTTTTTTATAAAAAAATSSSSSSSSSTSSSFSSSSSPSSSRIFP